MNVMEDLKAYLDGELSPERRTEIEAAMEQDEDLRQELEEIRILSRLIGDCVVETEPVGLDQTLAALERERSRSRPLIRLFKEPLRFGWVWALTGFVLLAIFWPVFGQSRDAAKASFAMRADSSKVAASPNADLLDGDGVVAKPELKAGWNTVGGAMPASEAPARTGQEEFIGKAPSKSLAEPTLQSPRQSLSGQGRRGKADIEMGVTQSSESMRNGSPSLEDSQGNIFHRANANGTLTGTVPLAGTPPDNEAMHTRDRGARKDQPIQSEGNVAAKAASPAPRMTPLLLIRTAELGIEVKDVRVAVAQASEDTKLLGGYVEQSSTSIDNNLPEAQMSIRVPQARFDDAMKRLSRLGKVGANSTSSLDVTNQVADTDARLREMRAEEESYIAMLRGTKHVEDTLAVRDRLDNVRQQIASLEAQDKTMRSQATYSTISLTLTQEAVKPKAPVQPSWFDQAWNGATERASGLGRWLAKVGMNLLVLSPVWVPIVGFVWWLGRRSRVRR